MAHMNPITGLLRGNEEFRLWLISERLTVSYGERETV